MRFYLCFLLFLFSQPILADSGNDPSFKKPNLAPNFNEAVNVLSEYLQIPSITGNEAPAGIFLSEYCKDRGLHVEIFSNEKNAFNFAASLYPLSTAKPNIILLNHLDVVPAGNEESWTYPPFAGTVTDSSVWGRGAIDCKGLAIMQLMGLLQFKSINQKNLPFNITFLAVSNEETGGYLGTSFIIKNYLEYLNPVVVLGEGGSALRDIIPNRPEEAVYGISIAEKTNLWLELSLKDNASGHGASPSNVYANKSMVEALSRLNNQKMKLKFNEANKLMFNELGSIIGGLQGFVIKNANWFLFRPFLKGQINNNPFLRSLLTNTVTITNINNPPGPPNQIASSSKATLDCRLLPGTRKKAFIKKIKKTLKEPQIEVKVIDEGPNNISTTPDDLFYSSMKNAINAYHNTENVHVAPFLFPASSDNAYFRNAGIPTYGIIPGILSHDEVNSVHNVNEKISKTALNSGIIIYYLFFENIAAQANQNDLDIEVAVAP